MPFDPTHPWEDPTVFFPNGMQIDNRQKSRHTKDDDDEEEEEETFILNASSLIAFSRFLFTAINLRTNRTEYLEELRIEDTPEIVCEALGKKIDDLMKTHSTIKDDGKQFVDVTWNKRLELASNVRMYVNLQGGTTETSYYTTIIALAKEYWKETQKDEPDESELQELKESIIYAVKMCREKIEDLQQRANSVVTELGAFESMCIEHDSKLQSNKCNILAQLEKEGNDMVDMQKRINDISDAIRSVQTNTEHTNELAMGYTWIGLFGGLRSARAIKNFPPEQMNMKAYLEKFRVILRKYDQQQKAAFRLAASIEFISSQITDLRNQFDPVKEDLQKFQGAWVSIHADLSAIEKLFTHDTDRVPPVRLTKEQLQGIMNRWKTLIEEVDAYIRNFYLVSEKEQTLDEYIEELNTRLFQTKMEERMQERMQRRLGVMAEAEFL